MYFLIRKNTHLLLFFWCPPCSYCGACTQPYGMSHYWLSQTWVLCILLSAPVTPKSSHEFTEEKLYNLKVSSSVLVRDLPEDLEKEMATPSSILAWKIPWLEEPGRLQSLGLHFRKKKKNFFKTSAQETASQIALINVPEK